MLTTILKSFDTFIIATASSSITLSLTGICLIAFSISSGIACGLTISNNSCYEIVMQKYKKYKKQYQKDQTIKSFDKLYRKSFQDNEIDKNDYESLFNVFTKYMVERKNESHSEI